MQLLPMASSPDSLISAWYAVITKTSGWEVLTTTRNVNVTQPTGGGGGVRNVGRRNLVQRIRGTHFYVPLQHLVQNSQIAAQGQPWTANVGFWKAAGISWRRCLTNAANNKTST